jgi:tetratricopeptide (TPR) repeat protein
LDTLQEALDAEDTRAVYPLMTAERGVKSALELSWRKLTADSQTMGKLLGLCAPGGIPWKLAEDMAKVTTEKEIATSVNQTRQQLANLHLLEWDEQRETATLHALVRKFLHQKAQSPDSLKQIFANTMLQHACQAGEDMNLERVAGMRDLVPHIEEVANHYTHLLSDDDFIWPFVGAAKFYHSQELYLAALPWYELCLKQAEQRLGADCADTATSLNHLAELYRSIGKYSVALPLYQRALQIREQQLGADRPDTATSLNNLAGLYYSIGKYSVALPLYQRALQIREQQLGADSPDTATSLNNLALLYRSMGKYSAALPLYQRALQICEQQLGADHPDTASSLNNLAIWYRSIERSAEAEPLYARAVQICEQSLGKEHPTTIIIRGNYEICLRDKEL